MVIISCLPIPAAEAQQTRLEFQILFSSPWYPAHGSPKVLKDFWGSDFEGQVHKQFQLSQLADVFCFEALVPQGANPESASPPTDSRRSGHFREGMERIPQKHTHTQRRKWLQAKPVEDAAHRDTTALSPLLEAPHPQLHRSSSISSGFLAKTSFPEGQD